MTSRFLDDISCEISALRRRYAAILREAPCTREADTRYLAETRWLRWFVSLDDVVESDIDVEISAEVLIVRACRSCPAAEVIVGILPVPHGFNPEPLVILFENETLEIRMQHDSRESGL